MKENGSQEGKECPKCGKKALFWVTSLLDRHWECVNCGFIEMVFHDDFKGDVIE